MRVQMSNPKLSNGCKGVAKWDLGNNLKLVLL